MGEEINKLHTVWENTQLTATKNTFLPQFKFEELINSIISTGPFITI